MLLDGRIINFHPGNKHIRFTATMNNLRNSLLNINLFFRIKVHDEFQICPFIKISPNKLYIYTHSCSENRYPIQLWSSLITHRTPFVMASFIKGVFGA